MNEEKALVTKGMVLTEVLSLAEILMESKYFLDIRGVAQGTVKILAGRELGFGPIASITGIYIVNNRVGVMANLMAQGVKRSEKYDYRVIKLTNEIAEIAFFEQGEEIGRSTFSKDDATKAGTQNMNKFPRNMLFARAMSNGVRFFCPDVFHTNVYTPEELGATVNAEGDVIEGQAWVQPPEPPSRKPPEPASVETVVVQLPSDPETPPESVPEAPPSAEAIPTPTLANLIAKYGVDAIMAANSNTPPASDADLVRIAGILEGKDG